METREKKWFWTMAAPAVTGFVFFVLGPMLYSLFLSFTKFDVVSPPVWIGTGNYSYLLHDDPAFWPSVRVTLIFTAVSVPLALIIALIVALLLNTNVRGIGVFRTIYYLPSLLPSVASGVLWVWVFDPNVGLFNSLLRLIGIQGPGWTSSVVWALPALIIMSLWGFGGSMVIFLAGLQGVSRSLYEAASLDGAGPWEKFVHVTIPQISPVIFFNLTTGLIGAMKVFDNAYVFGAASGAGPGGPARATLFYVLNLYQKAFNYFHMGLGSAMAWLLFIAIMVLTAINFLLAKRWVHQAN
ncbi:MAG TPA: sugar ABC transporter permease [Capsulimonadaceae bacterium]|jgi:multiple sugar transport system permease protein